MCVECKAEDVIGCSFCVCVLTRVLCCRLRAFKLLRVKIIQLEAILPESAVDPDIPLFAV